MINMEGWEFFLKIVLQQLNVTLNILVFSVTLI